MTVLEPPPAIDGRTRRRETNRSAVVESLLELYAEGALSPSAEEIAQRAGISARSLFRYFDDVDDLVRASIEHQQDRLQPLWDLDATPDQPLDARIERFVAARAALLEGMGEVGRVARRTAPFQPAVAAELARVRAALRAQLEHLFAPELDARGPAQAAVLASLDVLTSWEGYDLMRRDQGLDRADAIIALSTGMRALLRADD